MFLASSFVPLKVYLSNSATMRDRFSSTYYFVLLLKKIARDVDGAV